MAWRPVNWRVLAGPIGVYTQFSGGGDEGVWRAAPVRPSRSLQTDLEAAKRD